MPEYFLEPLLTVFFCPLFPRCASTLLFLVSEIYPTASPSSGIIDSRTEAAQRALLGPPFVIQEYINWFPFHLDAWRLSVIPFRGDEVSVVDPSRHISGYGS